MAHQAQFNFVEDVKRSFPEMFENKNVLEIGSLDINGSVRDVFSNCSYIGVDLDYGSGVDFVCAGQDLKFRPGFFDVSISCECFEHNPYWFETFTNMIRMTKHLVIVTCATEGRPEHGTSRTSAGDSPFNAEWNYYRNLTAEDFHNSCDFSMFQKFEFYTNQETHDLYFWGVKHLL
jgi:hypothetical protein